MTITIASVWPLSFRASIPQTKENKTMMQYVKHQGIYMNVIEKHEDRFKFGGEFEGMLMTTTGCAERFKVSRDELEDYQSTDWYGRGEVYNERHLLSMAHDLLAKGHKIRKRGGVSERLESFVRRHHHEAA
jgi:hypothetical protein